ncbi:hypothetical protein B5566_02480 [Mycobacterium sp. MHSD3]|nr:hypothetical protein B5566_02480 [Mycobacterium sp. MHSD3]
MPGAQSAPKDGDRNDPAKIPPTATDKAGAESGGLNVDERNELERYRAIHKDEKLWETRAKSNYKDAEAFRNLSKLFGGEGSEKQFDPESAIKQLTEDFTAERTARLRSDVARTEGVDLEDFTGSTEEEMRASAQRFKAKLQAKIDAALEAADKKPASAAAPTTDVNSGGKVTAGEQIKSRDDLKTMSPKDRLDAYKDGRLDEMLGRS